MLVMLTKVTSAPLVEEGDVLVHDGLVEVFAEVAGDALREDIEDRRAETDANARDLSQTSALTN